MTEHPDSNFIDIFAPILEDFQFKPTIHVHYESKTVSVRMVYQSSKICLKNLTVLEKFYQSENFSIKVLH